ncbi:MAG: hypothetical protein WBV94_09840 [Blastocatellia bacterium]
MGENIKRVKDVIPIKTNVMTCRAAGARIEKVELGILWQRQSY